MLFKKKPVFVAETDTGAVTEKEAPEREAPVRTEKIPYDRGAYQGILNMFTKNREKAEFLTKVRDGEISKEDFEKEILSLANELYPNTDAKELAKAIIDNVIGYNVLTDIIYDKDVTDIKVHDWNHIVIKKKGLHMVSPVQFESEDDYLRFIDGVITRNKVNASTQNAIQRFTDTTSMDGYRLRFTLVTSFLNTNEKPILVIRKVAVDFPEMDELVELKMMTPEISEYIKEAWKKGSILFCGANASGKTTLLNASKEFIPPYASVLVIQQAEELTAKRHPDMMFLHSFEGVGENAVRYDLKDLSIAGLTLDVEYFIIGEVKGAEAMYLLNASYTGSKCGGTVHANDSQSALDKIVDYAFYASDNYTKEELMTMLLGFKTIVFLDHFKVTEISNVTGIENGKVTYDTVYRETVPDRRAKSAV